MANKPAVLSTKASHTEKTIYTVYTTEKMKVFLAETLWHHQQIDPVQKDKATPKNPERSSQWVIHESPDWQTRLFIVPAQI